MAELKRSCDEIAPSASIKPRIAISSEGNVALGWADELYFTHGGAVVKHADIDDCRHKGDISCLTFTPSNKLISCGTEKSLTMWSPEGDFLGTKYSSKRFTDVAIDNKETVAVTADRFGDVISFPLESFDPSERPVSLPVRAPHNVRSTDHSDETVEAVKDCKASKPAAPRSSDSTFLAGHVSVLTSLHLNADNTRCITTTRDEKVRISKFPNAHEIDSFCLGHMKYVSSACSLQNGQVVSSGGDGTLRVWNPENGAQLAVLQKSSSNAIELVTAAPVGDYVAYTVSKSGVLTIGRVGDRSLTDVTTLDLGTPISDIVWDKSGIYCALSSQAAGPVVLLTFNDNTLSKTSSTEVAAVNKAVLKELEKPYTVESIAKIKLVSKRNNARATPQPIKDNKKEKKE